MSQKARRSQNKKHRFAGATLRFQHRDRLASIALVSAAIVINALPSAAIAQSAPSATTAGNTVYTFSIPSQPLGQALNALGKRAGMPISVDSSLVVGKTSPAVNGSMTVSQALQKVLADSGLTAEVGKDSIVVRQAQSSTGVSTLPTVTVTGNTVNPENEINPPTTVGSKVPLTQREIPQTVTVVSQQQIQDQNLNTVSDVLANTPGITVMRQPNTDVLGDVIYARGWQITNYNIDGIPTIIGTVPLTSMAMYDRVEVLHGAAGLYEGLGGAGGTVNVVHKQPSKDYALNSTTSVGGNNTYVQQLDVTGALNQSGTLTGRGVVSWQKLGRDNGTFDKDTTLYGILQADVSPRTTVQLGASYNAGTGRPDVGFPVYSSDGSLPHLSRSHDVYPDWFRYTNDEMTVFGNITHRFSNNWQLKLASTYTKTKLLNVSGYPETADDNGDFTVYPQRFLDTNRQQAYDVFVEGPLDILNRELDLTVGGNYFKKNEVWDNLQNYYGFSATDYTFDGSESVFNDITEDNIWEPHEQVKTTNYGVYVNARYHILKPLTLVLGGRMGWYKTSTDETLDSLGVTSSSNTKMAYHNKTTPFVGLVYDIDKNYSVYTSYSTIFQPYDVTDKNGNLLKPLQGRQYEVGIKGSYFDDRLNTSVALFRGVQNDRAVPDPTNPDYSVNGGSASVKGVETTISGKPLENLTVSAGYTYLTTKIYDSNTSGTSFSEYTPKHMFKLWSKYQLPGKFNKWSIGGSVFATSDAIYSSTRAPGYATFGTSIGYKWSNHVQLNLSISNIFNRYYYTVPSYLENHIGQGRDAMLTAQISY